MQLCSARVAHSLQHGENLTGWLSVIDWRADDYAVTFCHFVEKFVANIIVEHTFAKVLGMASTFGEAVAKAEEATQTKLPTSGKVLISVNDRDKDELEEVARGFIDCGFEIVATSGTAAFLRERGIEAKTVEKLGEGRPNVLDVITNKEANIVINTPTDKKGAIDDSYIRKGVIKSRVAYMTTMAMAKACIDGIKAVQAGNSGVKSLQDFHAEIK